MVKTTQTVLGKLGASPSSQDIPVSERSNRKLSTSTHTITSYFDTNNDKTQALTKKLVVESRKQQGNVKISRTTTISQHQKVLSSVQESSVTLRLSLRATKLIPLVACSSTFLVFTKLLRVTELFHVFEFDCIPLAFFMP